MNRFTTILFTFLCVAATAGAQQPYKMAGPYEVVARDGAYRSSKAGSERDMKAALILAQTGRTEEAVRIIDAYAGTLQRLDGHDAPLCAIQCYWLVSAMNTLKMQRAEWNAMVRRALLPMLDKFEADSPYANGNWGAIVNRLRMACGIYLKDSTIYQNSVNYFLYANDNGSLPRYISPTGQCQETGRDQAHAQLGLGALVETCQMAWAQGDDLWGALDNRLMRGLEYTARYNLGYDVPFERWTDCTGLYNDWTEPGSMGRGVIRDIYQPAYEHYVKVKGQKMPYVKKLLALQRKAEKQGKVNEGMEARSWRVPGVQEGKKLHQVFTYPAPEGAPLKHDYDVYVQPRGGKEWIKIDTYMARVNAYRTPGSADASAAAKTGAPHRVAEISYAVFDFTGDVSVRVVARHRKFKTARIRPDYRGTIANVQNDSTVQFLLFQPENVSVELGGNITDNLLIFTSKPPVGREEAEREARRQGRQFVYIPAGFYNDAVACSSLFRRGKEGAALIPSGTTVYIEGGAYCTGTFAIEEAHDVSILGRGIARPGRGYEGCHVYHSTNVVVDGLVVNTCPVGGSDGVSLHDVRCISYPSWGDGLNVFASSNVLYDRVFCRTSDDCTTAYATRKGFEGSVRNVCMRNSTLWADVAHPIFIGLHGAAAGPHPERRDTIEHLRYENIDILGQAEPQVDYQGCLAINAGDNNLVRDVVFDNIRIEQLQQGCILQVKVGFNAKYCKAPGMGVEDVTFRNVRYYGPTLASDQGEGPRPSLSIINGYNEQRKVRNITFEGLKINGRKVYDDMPGKPKWYATADYAPLFVGNHVEGISFRNDERE